MSRYFSAGASGGLLLMSVVNPLRVRTSVPDNITLCDEVRRREAVLVAVAKDEAKRQSVLYHLVPLGAATVSGAVLALAYDNQWRNALVNTAVSYFVTELRILTAPNRARTALRRYRQGDIGGEGAKAAWSIAPVVLGRDGTGVALSVLY